jgi:hypothetical protein
MRRLIAIALLLCLPTSAFGATKTPEGRWEGPIQIPGREMQIVVDLAQDTEGAWAGSIIIPGLGIKGAPLSNVVVTGGELAFDTGNALGSPPYGPAAFKARLTAAGGMAGEMSQGGNVAKFSLERFAPAQVELIQRSTPVARDIEHEWRGVFELGGYPRHVTITLENHAGAGATAQFVIVGKQTNNLPVDLVIEEGAFLRIESQSNHVAFEGRVIRDSGEIRGIIELGPFELPLVLHRVLARAS